MAAYCFFDVREVVDPVKLEEYTKGVLNIVQHYGGRYLLLGGEVDSIEGNWKPTFPVLIQFPNMETARQWYHSEEYKTLKALRLAGAICDAVIMQSAPSEFVSAD